MHFIIYIITNYSPYFFNIFKFDLKYLHGNILGTYHKLNWLNALQGSESAPYKYNG